MDIEGHRFPPVLFVTKEASPDSSMIEVMHRKSLQNK